MEEKNFDTERRLIYAPPCAGKSYSSQKHPNRYIDGDVVIHQTIGWNDWEVRDDFHSHAESELINYIKKNRGLGPFRKLLLFNGHWNTLPFCVVNPPLYILNSLIKKRIDSKEGWGWSKTFKELSKIVYNTLDYHLTFASYFDVPVVSSFDEAWDIFNYFHE
jgi:hypothetical protein